MMRSGFGIENGSLLNASCFNDYSCTGGVVARIGSSITAGAAVSKRPARSDFIQSDGRYLRLH